ncbi:IclR family transcriptional regulator [Noviherbaspirillum sedimenti]|uniref:IclR family transcriptional regulator n=1 Tax=Noviherbaspirillum sedimenti TaxID=2320865 RepID=A0A3A3G3Q8_9BURK|nr:IclR family transcriptional regulator [Noviherbaspirillum sedimenti]RJG03117.1 IclR family transcriptional regulator [Noviherbaspirillum sedimenti]
MKESDSVQSVSRALDLLRLVAAAGNAGARLLDLVTESQLSKPTAHRLLKQLVASGMLMQGNGRAYHLGPGAFELGIAASRSFPLRDIAAPVLEKLAQETGDSVFLAIRSGPDSLCIDRKLGSYPVKVLTVEPGHRQPLGVGAGGLAMLSFLDEADRETVLAAIEPRLEKFSGLTPQRMRLSIEETRQRGWSQVADFVIPDVTSVGIPLLDKRNQAFAAISVGAVSLRMNKAKIAHAVALLKEQAKLLEALLLKTS